jgi:protease-4
VSLLSLVARRSMRRLRGASLAALTVALVGCHGRPRTWSSTTADLEAAEGKTRSSESPKSEGEIVEIDLTRGAPESASSSLFGTGSRQTYYRLVTLLKQVATEPASSGVLVRFGGARFGWARAQELADLFAKVKQSKKHVVCHADEWSNQSSWIAARGCERVWVSPAGGVDATGLAAELVYLHRLLTEKLGIDVDFLQIGRYKGAEEPFTRDSPSPEARASLEGVLGAIREQWLQGVAEARGAAAREAAEDGPFSAEEAKKRALVDAVGYLDEARDEAKKLSGAQNFDVRFGVAAHASDRPDLGEFVRVLAGGTASRGGVSHVALVRAVGAISMDSGGGPFGQRSGITERRLGRTIRSLTDDATVKAVVLRIDSPGGSALASDLIWRALMQLRAKKPLVVSVGDMAASGGYYLASAANRIFAEPASIVGSIGVVGGKLAFGPALEKLGVHVEVVGAPGSRAAERASYESALIPWDAATRERVRAEMTAVYDLFLKRVAEGRGTSVDAVAAAAEGRIFAGAAAKDQGLVDEWGGIEQAIEHAKKLGKLDENAPVRVEGDAGGLFDWFDDDSPSDDALAPRLLRRLAGVPRLGPAGDAQGADIDTFLGTVAPLANGEKTLAALPYVLLLH